GRQSDPARHARAALDAGQHRRRRAARRHRAARPAGGRRDGGAARAVRHQRPAGPAALPRSHLTHGVVIAAPASGSGKTLVTLALIHLLSREGRVVAPFKTGPDYIDGAYHRAASAGRLCFNLDLFAMRPETIAAILHDGAADAAFAVIAGVMRLVDGAADAEGSTADLAARLGLPVILVSDASHQRQSAAALAHGFRSFRADVRIGGVILNRVASERHERLLSEAFAPLGLPVL